MLAVACDGFADPPHPTLPAIRVSAVHRAQIFDSYLACGSNDQGLVGVVAHEGHPNGHDQFGRAHRCAHHAVLVRTILPPVVVDVVATSRSGSPVPLTHHRMGEHVDARHRADQPTWPGVWLTVL